MAQRGQASTAHEYDKMGACIHCGMYRNNVERISHVCTSAREAIQDEIDRVKAMEQEANDHGE